MCYVTAPARIWKKILKSNLKIHSRKPTDLLNFFLDLINELIPDGWAMKQSFRMSYLRYPWFLDQYTLSNAVHRFLEGDPAKGVKGNRHKVMLGMAPMECKLDRYCRHTEDSDIATDAHLFRYSHSDQLWPTLDEFITKVLPVADVEFIRQYRNRFVFLYNIQSKLNFKMA